MKGQALDAELAQAARIVARVAAGNSLAEQLDAAAAAPSSASRAALIDLTHGTLRRYGRVQAVVRHLSRRDAFDERVQALLWCALYALESGRHSEHAVVDQTVRACALLERWPAKGYVNALLRRYLRERSSVAEQIARDRTATHQHPDWWIELLQAAYPDVWQDILAAGNGHPPMCLRVNPRRADVDGYERRLAGHGIRARRCGAQALMLERPMPVERLPRFAEGEVSVQDLGAQRAAYLLDLGAGQRVLDACAAPGGKSAHILELADVALSAIDIDGARAARIAPDLARLGLRAHVLAADACQPEQWWDGQAFDRILADVPCSASGIVRRRPDVKWLRRASDLASFAERQRAMLGALWRLLAPGGKLLYVTCSVFPQENENVVEQFAGAQPGARRLPLPDDLPAQWLPDAEHDGFFYALIEKRL